MSKSESLTPKQRKVLDDLFDPALDEPQVLERHRVSRSAFEKWLDQDAFARQFERKIRALRRRSELLVAKYARVAAARLIELTGSPNAETARKACLDIIAAPKTPDARDGESPPTDVTISPPDLSDAAAEKILELLAKEKNENPRCHPTDVPNVTCPSL